MLLFHINVTRQLNTHQLCDHHQFCCSFLPSLRRHTSLVLFSQIWSVVGDLVYHLTCCLLNLWQVITHQWKHWMQMSNLLLFLQFNACATFTIYLLLSQYCWSIVLLWRLHFGWRLSFFHKINQRFVIGAWVWNSCQKINLNHSSLKKTKTKNVWLFVCFLL